MADLGHQKIEYIDKNTEINGYLSQEGIFGGIHLHDNSTGQNIGTGVTYTKITSFTDNEYSANVTSDAANDKITITKAGIYRVSGSFSFESDTPNVVFFGAPFLGGIEQDNIHFNRKVSVAGDVGSASFTGFIDVTTAPVDLDFRVRHDNGGTVAITLTYANINIEYLGET